MNKKVLLIKNNLSMYKPRLFSFIIIFILLGTCFTPVSLAIEINQEDILQSYLPEEGQILFAPMWGTTTYLINNNGVVNHTWSSIYFPGVSVWWLGDGAILRTIRVGAGPGSGGAGGGVQKVLWDGTIEWDFRYNSGGCLSHHDVKTLPNGNILLIAWETKTRIEAIAAGRNPNYISHNGFMPDHVIEVQQTGPSSGEIVWEWHAWDHLIQDYDQTKDNYGDVEDHPELIDANYATSAKSDWLHTNSIDYNEEFDQILLSIHNFNEIWVIDHSTTTEEAASHSGGNSGKGGDLLYRWGNPEVYRAGSENDRKLFKQHDATWIKQDYPGEGNILIFNNGANRPGGQYSSVDEIVPPVDEEGNYYLETGSSYGPESQTWTYTANPPTSFYSNHLSGAQRLSTGNTMISDGTKGGIFEVNPEGATLWEYANPYPTPSSNELFKAVYIANEEPPEPGIPDLDCTGSISWNDIRPGETVNGSFEIQNIGGNNSLLNWTIDISSIDWGTWTFEPASGENLTPEDGKIVVQVLVVTPNKQKTEFDAYIKVENKNDPNDFDLIPVYLKTPKNIYSFKTMLFQILIEFLRWSSDKIWNIMLYYPAIY